MADDPQQVGQDEIEQLLNQAQGGAQPPENKPAAPPASKTLGQDEIEALLNQGGASNSAPQPPSAAGPHPGESSAIESLLNEVSAAQAPPKAVPEPRKPPGDSGALAQGDLEYLLSQAEQALASINQPSQTAAAADTKPFRLVDFAGAPPSSDSATLDLIRDVELDLRIELGRTHMYLEEVLKLCKGAVVPLDKLAGDPVDIFVNGRLIARGEVLILNDNFCVRVAELVAGDAAASA